MNFSVSLQPILIREQAIRSIRNFFNEKSFHEVIPTVLNEALPLEEALHPFRTKWNANEKAKSLFLSMSPERSLKLMLAMGMDDVFAFGKSFRNLEAAGPTHSPEFLMLEWYRKHADMFKIMNDVEELFAYLLQEVESDAVSSSGHSLVFQNQEIVFQEKWPVLSLNDEFKKRVGVSISDVTEMEDLVLLAKEKKYQTENATWEQLFNQIVLNEVEPFFPTEPFFLIDFPSNVSPLCAAKKNPPELAQRFEFFINGIEIGNGNTENTDENLVRKTFEKVQQQRSSVGSTSLAEEKSDETQPIDEDFLEALRLLQEDSLAGIGMGVDRVAMLFSNQTEIQAVEPFALK